MCSSDLGVLDVRIPQLIIHTFVENALKYTMNWGDEVMIFLSGKKVEKEGVAYLEIVIEDNGEGFPEEVLTRLQKGENISEGERRIGIVNAVQRLQIKYEDKAVCQFYKCQMGGAGIRLDIPIN